MSPKSLPPARLWTAHLICVLAMVTWSSGLPANSFLMPTLHPMGLAAARMILAAAVLMPFWLWWDGWQGLRRANWTMGIAVGSFVGLGSLLVIAGQSLTDAVTARSPAHFQARLDPAMVADAERVARAMGNGGERLVNALSPEQFAGTGGAQERNRRAGTENLPAVTALAAALQALEVMRAHNDTYYYNIYDTGYHVLMHPFRKDLVGKDMKDFRTGDGIRIYYDQIEAAKAGVSNYIIKPFTPDQVQTKLEAIFSKR